MQALACHYGVLNVMSFSSAQFSQDSTNIEFQTDNPISPEIVLVVDDDSVFRALVRRILGQDNYSILEAVNGEDCLTKYRSHGPDVVLLDAVMPIMDGFTCCNELRQITTHYPAPILMITGAEPTNGVERAFAAGATDYISKPVNGLVLRHRVRHLARQTRFARQIQRLLQHLEHLVQHRTAELEQALRFESLSRQITENIRDVLDESEILQTAVQELAIALQVGCCNASVYNETKTVAHVQYEYAPSVAGYQGRQIDMERSFTYRQLLSGQYVGYSTLTPNPNRGRVAMFAFPIQDKTNVLGDLWLITEPERVLSHQEMVLVQQVASQCAIALRQAKLYQEAQANVRSLEAMARTKDDWLSIISHEMRRPIANMQMMIPLLDYALTACSNFLAEPQQLRSQLNSCSQYVALLGHECDQEMALIDNLLMLKQLELGTVDLFEPVLVVIDQWLASVAAPFEHQIRDRNLTLTISIPTNSPTLVIYPDPLRRIITELLTNACKYTPSGEAIGLTVVRLVDGIQLRVMNSGVDISPDECDRIFDQFYRIPGGDRWQQGGTGLGLTLVQRLVDYINGQIRVESGNNHTTFIVTLPLLESSW